MNLVGLLVVLVVIGLLIGLVYYICDSIPVPQPLNKILKIVSMVIGILAVILLLLQIAGIGPNLNLQVSYYLENIPIQGLQFIA